MPAAPKQYRPLGYERREKAWASRQTDYRAWYQLDIWKGKGGLREQAVVRDLFQCQECGEFVMLHTTQGSENKQAHVDHRIPHCGDWAKFIDLDNLRTLCGRCHSRKTLREQRS